MAKDEEAFQGLVRVTRSGKYFISVWSPRGDWLAFETTREGNLEIYNMKSEGPGLVLFYQNTALDAGPPWSPDGCLLLIYSNRSREDSG